MPRLILDGSPPGGLSAIDWKKVGIGALVAVGGALLTYGTQFVTDTDFGAWTPVVVAGWSTLVNLARKWLTDTR